jgi:DNA (cytosine-5)-methyltransferase 1
MNYIDEINEMLKPQEYNYSNRIVIDLFAGCGGLSLGFEAHGFKTVGYEKDKNACDTYNLNLNGFCHNEELTVNTDYHTDSDILIGGPPCQPFSAFGRKLGLKDSRDGFPIFISAVEKIKPEIFLFENVRGLLFERNRWYLEQVLEKLEKLNYIVDYKLLNAKHFGVPQSRERLFVVGYKEGVFPPMLAYHIAQSVKKYLSTSSLKKNYVKNLSRSTRINKLELFGISEKIFQNNLNL